MLRWSFLLVCLVFLPHAEARAQVMSSIVVSACGTPPSTYTAGQAFPATMDTTGKFCDTGGGGGGGGGTVTQGPAAAITGGWPVTDGAGTDISGTITGTGAGSVSASIDGYANAKVLISGTYAGFTINITASSNGGAIAPAYQCAKADGTAIGSTFVLTANSSVEISCGHLGGDDTLVVSTSAGPASGTASVDISPSSFPNFDGSSIGVFASLGAFVDGAIVTLGTEADAAWTSGSGTLVGIQKAIANSLGAPGATACTTDTASCNLNQQMQRLAQRLTTINTTLGTPLQTGGNAGGYDTIVATTPTVQNASYSASNALGTTSSVAVFRSSGGSGIATEFWIASKGGSTVGVTVYAFTANPTSSTCTDKSAFVLNAADVSKLAFAPFVVTPAVTQGTTSSFAEQAMTKSIKNTDGSPTSNLYVCLVANATVTPASTTDLVFGIGIAQD